MQVRAEVLRKEIIIAPAARRVLNISFFLLLTALGAFVYLPLPFTPVPVTLQTFFVVLCAALLPKRDAVLTQSAYVLAGIAGLPVFTAAGFGLGRLLGPTGGYLIGFMLAPVVIRAVMAVLPRHGFLAMVAAMTAGMAAIYTCGVIGLAVSLQLTPHTAFMLGAVPFAAADSIKIMAAAALVAIPRIKTLFA